MWDVVIATYEEDKANEIASISKDSSWYEDKDKEINLCLMADPTCDMSDDSNNKVDFDDLYSMVEA